MILEAQKGTLNLPTIQPSGDYWRHSPLFLLSTTVFNTPQLAVYVPFRGPEARCNPMLNGKFEK